MNPTLAPPRDPRILVVDDEPVVRQIIDRVLSSSAYEVMTVPSAKEMDKVVAAFQPDLIILDVMMPDEDGWQLCQRLRKDKRFDSISIVFLSAMGDDASVRKGFACGGDSYLPKPFEMKELKHLIEVFVGRKHRHPNESAQPNKV